MPLHHRWTEPAAPTQIHPITTTQHLPTQQTSTFLDLLACARHLAATRYTSPCRLALWGRSAGGLAVAAALNLQPDCCGAAVLDVPFLDVLRTMLDTSLLLTVKERGEWGDPLNDEVGFRLVGRSSVIGCLGSMGLKDVSA
jgi:protease II